MSNGLPCGNSVVQQTPLIMQHRAAGAKLVDFAGWEMPIQYSGVVDEYQAVRRKAGLFDVSHMGRFRLTGTDAAAFLQQMTTNDIGKLGVGQAQYSLVCNERGGIKDDIFVYRIGAGEFWLCVNASNREKIFFWLQSQLSQNHRLELKDRSDVFSQIAVQGPKSRELLMSLGGAQLNQLKLHHTMNAFIGSLACTISRTGYSGELGYELYIDAQVVGRLWSLLLEKGQAWGLKPAGLGARDLLRLEMGYPLYGNDISEDVTPLEANSAWVVDFTKGDFMGRAALVDQQGHDLGKRFVAFELLEKAVPRHGYRIMSPRSEEIGRVTSGNFSPILQKGIGLGYVFSECAELAATIMIDIRGKAVPARVVKPPFYRRASK